ncbi:MAG: 3-deoxy-D-manno-octulosonic acid kinase [Xanthomonadales bacterium]|nr:3-deoxy-D-manno-octulosonic acid kinase [Xanthomonadales bacterium]
MSIAATALPAEAGQARRLPLPGGAMLCVAERAETVSPAWFEPAHWLGRCRVHDTAGGRGGSLVIRSPIGPLLLRRYLRGGLAARLTRDRYLFRGEEATRSFREFRLLLALAGRGLPVPLPVAAAYWRSGWSYRAAILLAFIPRARPLPLCFEELGAEDFRAIGAAVGRLHQAGVRHADLNAWNVLLDAERRVWIVDFDRARLVGARAPRIAGAVLARLLRSLRKLAADRRVPGFAQRWRDLLAGHAEVLGNCRVRPS